MNPKRIAGVINIIAAVAFISVGLMQRPIRVFFVVIGAIFLLIGYLRLRREPPIPPAG